METNKIPTAEEWLLNHKELSIYDVADYDEGGYSGVNENKLYTIMIEFAQFHVNKALKEVANSVVIQGVNRNAVINSYPLKNIK